MKTINFLLVDDHPVVRDGMEAMLMSEEDFDSLGTAADATEALEALEGCAPDVIITDVRMPRGDGFTLLKEVRKRHPKVKVLMIAGSPTAAERDEAKALGASGYISKSADLERLVEVVRKIAAGCEFVCDGKEDVPAILSMREREVLRLFSQGKTREEVAQALDLGTETVKTHVRIIMKKLGVPNTLSAVTSAIKMGIIRP
ncbi:MAG: response regulator transcription factor [Kiritimatiellae bacterium]|nr:response regulator transcription factor [Kiritimatiellia bacterium]